MWGGKNTENTFKFNPIIRAHLTFLRSLFLSFPGGKDRKKEIRKVKWARIIGLNLKVFLVFLPPTTKSKKCRFFFNFAFWQSRHNLSWGNYAYEIGMV